VKSEISQSCALLLADVDADPSREVDAHIYEILAAGEFRDASRGNVPCDTNRFLCLGLQLLFEESEENPGVKGVYTTLCETSTATVYDIKTIGEMVRKTDALFVVDTISGLGADDFENDAWGVDIAVCGSQKGLMIPPGLAFSSVSEKAWKAVETSKLPKFYFNFKKYKKAYIDTDTPFTSAITLMIGLRKAVEMINKKGIDSVIAEHAAQAIAFREAMKAIGLTIFSKSPSNAVTGVHAPGGINADDIIKLLKTEFGVTFAGGQENLKGRIFRVAHMGGIDEEHTIESIKALEAALTKLGHKFKAGSGLAAAEKILK